MTDLARPQSRMTELVTQAKIPAPQVKPEALTQMFVGATLVGLFALLLNSLQYWSSPKLFAAASTGILAAGAAFLAGGLIGFVFGIPRTLQGETPATALTASQTDTVQQATVSKVTYGANTNLEQISDWLTKILLGAGLTQLAKIPTGVEILATRLAFDVGGSRALAAGLLLYFLFCGFFVAYLGTRLWLPAALHNADLLALEERVVEQGSTLSRQEEELKYMQVALQGIVTQYEYDKLEGLSKEAPFFCYYSDDMMGELKRLRAMGLVKNYDGQGIRAITQQYKNTGSQFDLRSCFFITDRGKEYLQLRQELAPSNPVAG
jgi:hypothetical protein